METSSLCSLIVGWGAGPAWACLSGHWVLVGRASLLRRLPDLEWLQVARDDKLTEGEKKKKEFPRISKRRLRKHKGQNVLWLQTHKWSRNPSFGKRHGINNYELLEVMCMGSPCPETTGKTRWPQPGLTARFHDTTQGPIFLWNLVLPLLMPKCLGQSRVWKI